MGKCREQRMEKLEKRWHIRYHHGLQHIPSKAKAAGTQPVTGAGQCSLPARAICSAAKQTTKHD